MELFFRILNFADFPAFYYGPSPSEVYHTERPRLFTTRWP